MQNEIVTNIETRDIADRTRISNFYRANTGKCKPVTFLCTKERKNNRDIGHLQLADGTELTDRQEIAKHMYQNTTNTP